MQNDPEVPAGIYEDHLAQAGVSYFIVESFRGAAAPALDDVTAVIVLGGSMGVHDILKYPFLLQVKDYIVEVLDAGKPYLGICLGGQLLADVLGADVSSGLHREVGTCRVTLTADGRADRLFQSVPGEFSSFQWHDDSFAIPGGAVRLAYSDTCPNQAFRHGQNAFGLQFHPEVNGKIVRDWCEGFETWDASQSGIISGFEKCANIYRPVSLRILDNFLDIARYSGYGLVVPGQEGRSA